MLQAIVSRTALPPVEIEELSLGDYDYRLPTAHIATLRPSLLASRTFPLDCGLNASQPIFEREGDLEAIAGSRLAPLLPFLSPTP